MDEQEITVAGHPATGIIEVVITNPVIAPPQPARLSLDAFPASVGHELTAEDALTLLEDLLAQMRWQAECQAMGETSASEHNTPEAIVRRRKAGEELLAKVETVVRRTFDVQG